jgi:CRISPR-associated protein Csc1
VSNFVFQLRFYNTAGWEEAITSLELALELFDRQDGINADQVEELIRKKYLPMAGNPDKIMVLAADDVDILVKECISTRLESALSDFSYGIYLGLRPNYMDDLKRFRLYATLGLGETASRTRITYNAVDSRALLTERPDRLRWVNTPDVGRRVYLNPQWEEKGTRNERGFLCYVFTFDGSVPKGLTRLGKKGTVFRIRSEELENPVAIFKEEATRPTHPVNPLDISGKVAAYNPIMLPPHMLFRTAEISEDWFVFSGRHRVHVPGRVMERA